LDQFALAAQVCKVDAEEGIVFGWAIISTENGQPYVDLQNDYVPEASVLKAAAKFAAGARVAKDTHEGAQAGTVDFIWPMTADIAKALGISTPRTGLLIGMRPSPEMLAKFKSGELTGFSIGGRGRRKEIELP
jgi:hypothetical protein